MPDAGKPRPPRFLYSPTWRTPRSWSEPARRRTTPARPVDRDLLRPDRDLAHRRSRPRDRGPALLRRRGRDQRLHGRVPGTEPRARSRRRPGAQLGVRAGVQRAARERRESAGLARRLEPLLPLRARADGSHRALHAARTVDHASVRLRGRAARISSSGSRACCSRCVALLGAVGDRRRDPEQLRAVHDPGAEPDLLESRDHRRRSSSACPRRTPKTAKLYVYAGGILVGTVIQVLLPVPVAHAARRQAAPR